jgi:hypothetical protein
MFVQESHHLIECLGNLRVFEANGFCVWLPAVGKLVEKMIEPLHAKKLMRHLMLLQGCRHLHGLREWDVVVSIAVEQQRRWVILGDVTDWTEWLKP